MLGISLQKGQKIDLTKGNPSIKNVTVGLGWDTNKYEGADFDLDASVFLLNENGKANSPADFIFYNNLVGGNGAVVHTGDNLTGDGDGDDETITVDLLGLPATVERIAFTVTIHDAEARGQNFGMVANAYIRIFDESRELLRFDLGENFSVETAIVAGELYRYNGEWKFSAIGAGYKGGLAALVNDFGLA